MLVKFNRFLLLFFRRLGGVRFLCGDCDLGSVHPACLLLLLLHSDQETLCQPEADRTTQTHSATTDLLDARGSFEGQRGHCLGRGGQAEAPKHWLAASKPNSKYIFTYTIHPLNSFEESFKFENVYTNQFSS